MSEWIHSTVGAVTVYQRAGGTPSATVDEYYGGEIPFVSIEDITKSTRFLDKTEKRLSEKGLLNSAAWLIKEPHILYSMYATVGKPIINHIPCATNQAIIALKESPEIEQSFLYYQLLFIRPQVYKYTAQTTQSNLNAGSVKKLSISYPKDRRQQQKIVAILSSIDVAIEKTEALIAKYQQIKVGLMHDLFTRGVTADGKLRSPREQAPELYQKTPIGWIPKEWEIMPLDEHVRIIDCKHYTPEFQSEGIPFIRPRNIKVDGLDLTSLDYVSAHDYQILTDIYRPRCGDIVFSRNASFGVPCYIDTDIQFAIGQDCVIMTTKISDTRYIFCALTNSITASQIAKVSGGSTFGRINLGEIRKLMIPHPGREEEHRIADRMFAHSNVSKSLKDELAKLHQQKLGLMSDLLTGRVRVKLAETEVASA